MSRLVLPDTNFFFECKKLEDLPCIELGAGPFVILLTKLVLDEIDEHKRRGGRTRKRAIEIFGRIRSMLRAEVLEERIEVVGVDVRLRLAGGLSVGDEPPKGLNPWKNDDRLVGIFSELVGSNEDAFLLSHDTGPISTAADFNLPFKLIPDSWLRPAESTLEEKRLKDLEGQLADYKKAEPVLTLRISGRSEPSPTVRRIINMLSPLSEDKIDLAIAALSKAHPPNTDYSDPPKPSPVPRMGGVLLSDHILYEKLESTRVLRRVFSLSQAAIA